MNSTDREAILNNLDKIISQTDYDQLLSKCQEYDLISNIMIRNIENDSGDSLVERHKNLLIKLTQRGPKAYNILLDICKELGYNETYQSLKPSSYSANNNDISIRNERRKQELFWNVVVSHERIQTDASPSNSEIKLEEYTAEVRRRFILKPATKLIKKGDKLPLEVYNMTTITRGILFLVNVIEIPGKQTRRGTTADKDNLISIFRQMNFRIFYYENLKRNEFEDLLTLFAESQQVLRNPDCLVVAVLTEGYMDKHSEFVCFSDGGIFEVEDIIKPFSNTRCERLIGKPKIFLFPFGRGKANDQEINVTVMEKRRPEVQFDGPQGPKRIPEEVLYPSFSDILICYATTKGFTVHQDADSGSWYIEKLCEVLAKYSHSATMEEMLKFINQEVTQIRRGEHQTNIQAPSFESRGFNKLLYFNPGIHG